MAITYENDDTKRGDVTMTECPKCGTPLRPNQGFAEHWSSSCPVNPMNQEDE